MSSNRSWSELAPRQRAVIVVAGTAEVVLTAIALRDLARRPAASVRGGRKWPWAVGCAIQPIGPIAYLTIGRQ